MWDDSGKFNSAIGEGSGPGVLYSKKQVALSGDTIWVYDESYGVAVCVVQISPYFNCEYIKPACVNLKGEII